MADKIPKPSELDDRHQKIHADNQKVQGHLKEDEALKAAAKDGIEFVDEYFVAPIDNINATPDQEKIHSSRKKAEADLAKLKDATKYTIVQRRGRKPNEN